MAWGRHGHKYGAKSTVVDGIKFPSKKEAKRYGELKILERAGEIQRLRLHERIQLCVNGLKICDYIPDATYTVTSTGELIVEDTKGFLTDVYKLKKKLVKAIHGIDVREV